MATGNAALETLFLAGPSRDIVATPACLYADLDAHFHFTFDPAPLGPTFDGLVVEWGTSNFINPPFSDIEPWVRRGAESTKQCVFLLPLRASSRYWRRYVWPHADVIYFITGPVQFTGYAAPLPLPIVIVVMHATAPLPVIASLGGIPVVTMRPDRGTASHTTQMQT